jgi:hypothetical protein
LIAAINSDYCVVQRFSLFEAQPMLERWSLTARALGRAGVGASRDGAAEIVALRAPNEAWHLTIQEAGGTVHRRVLYRGSSMGVLGGLVSAQVAVAARIAAPLVTARQPPGADTDSRGVSDAARSD